MRPSRAALLGLSLLSSLLLSTAAWADVVVHDGGVSRDRDASGRVERQTGQRPAKVLPADVLAGPSRLLAAEVSVERCEGEGIHFDPTDYLDRATEQVLGFDLEGAAKTLDMLGTLLPCSDTVQPKGLLARASFLRGALLFDEGKEAEARNYMADAAVVDWEYTGERGFPAAHLDLLVQVRDSLSAGRLFLWPGPAARAVHIDGELVEDSGSEGVGLGVGRHLLQIETADGLQGAWIHTKGTESVLVQPGAGRDIWRDLGRSPGGQRAMSLLLRHEFGSRDGAVHTLQYRGGHRAVTWPIDGGAPEAWEAGGAADSRTERKPRKKPARKEAKAKEPRDWGRRLHVAVGAGYQVAHPHNYAMLAVDVSVRLVGPLELGVLLRPSYGGQVDVQELAGEQPVSRPVFFAPLGLSLGVRKAGAISPFVGVAGQFAWNRDGYSAPEFFGGVAAAGGVDLSPGDGVVAVRIQGEVGVLHTVFNARISGGVAFRF